MVSLINQLAVDDRDQLTVAQPSCSHQHMFETQELRDAFVARLNKALDGKDGVRKGRGRNVDFLWARENINFRLLTIRQLMVDICLTPPETTAGRKATALYTTRNPRGVIPAKPVQRE